MGGAIDKRNTNSIRLSMVERAGSGSYRRKWACSRLWQTRQNLSMQSSDHMAGHGYASMAKAVLLSYLRLSVVEFKRLTGLLVFCLLVVTQACGQLSCSSEVPYSFILFSCVIRTCIKCKVNGMNCGVELLCRIIGIAS